MLLKFATFKKSLLSMGRTILTCLKFSFCESAIRRVIFGSGTPALMSSLLGDVDQEVQEIRNDQVIYIDHTQGECDLSEGFFLTQQSGSSIKIYCHIPIKLLECFPIPKEFLLSLSTTCFLSGSWIRWVSITRYRAGVRYFELWVTSLRFVKHFS